MNKLKKDRKISAGSYDINKWLYGGYDKDIITTIYGDAGTGKTNFCLLAAVSQIKKQNKVIFIDTEGGFSVDRLKQLLNVGANPEQDYEKLLENILLIKPMNFEQQKKAFNKILKSLSNVKLIIVDGITMLYRLELGDAIQQKDENKIRSVNKELARQLRILAEIARTKHIPVIVTNQVYREFLTEEQLKQGLERRYNMVGGDLLKYWSKCLIELQDNRDKRIAILRKHRSLPKKELNFIIKNRGVFKKGWI